MSAEFPTSQKMAQQQGALPAPGQATAVTSPAERLAQSRERLREYMTRADARQQAKRRTAAAKAAGESAAILDRLRAIPLIGPVMEVLLAWWESHPLHSAASLAADVAEETVAPLARKHPFALVAAAFGVGVGIAWLKPWKHIRTSVLLTGFASQVLSRAIAQMPWESMLGVYNSFAQSNQAASASAPAPAPDDVARDASPRDSVGEDSAAASTFKREAGEASALAQASS